MSQTQPLRCSAPLDVVYSSQAMDQEVLKRSDTTASLESKGSGKRGSLASLSTAPTVEEQNSWSSAHDFNEAESVAASSLTMSDNAGDVEEPGYMERRKQRLEALKGRRRARVHISRTSQEAKSAPNKEDIVDDPAFGSQKQDRLRKLRASRSERESQLRHLMDSAAKHNLEAGAAVDHNANHDDNHSNNHGANNTTSNSAEIPTVHEAMHDELLSAYEVIQMQKMQLEAHTKHKLLGSDSPETEESKGSEDEVAQLRKRVEELETERTMVGLQLRQRITDDATAFKREVAYWHEQVEEWKERFDAAWDDHESQIEKCNKETEEWKQKALIAEQDLVSFKEGTGDTVMELVKSRQLVQELEEKLAKQESAELAKAQARILELEKKLGKSSLPTDCKESPPATGESSTSEPTTEPADSEAKPEPVVYFPSQPPVIAGKGPATTTEPREPAKSPTSQAELLRSAIGNKSAIQQAAALFPLKSPVGLGSGQDKSKALVNIPDSVEPPRLLSNQADFLRPAVDKKTPLQQAASFFKSTSNDQVEPGVPSTQDTDSSNQGDLLRNVIVGKSKKNRLFW